MNMSLLNKIPELSEQSFVKASYICGGVVFACSIFFCYEMFTVADFGFDIEWNIFESVWFTPLFIIGLLLAIVNWGKFGHWGGQPYDVYKDSYGNKYTKRNDDIIENLFAHILLPILGHFVFEPIIYACLIFYPLMCVFALLDIVLPYVITLFLMGLSTFFFMSQRYMMKISHRSFILILVTLLVGGGLTWISVNMEQTKISLMEESFLEERKSVEENIGNTSDNEEQIDDMFNGI